jgi:hypothetical protein
MLNDYFKIRAKPGKISNCNLDILIIVTEGSTRAINFSFEWQEFTGTDEFKKLARPEGRAKAIAMAIKKVLKNYPDAVVSDDIKFPDGSRAILTNKGFRVVGYKFILAPGYFG